VVVVFLGVFRWNVSRDREVFERRIAAIRAAGQPVTADDFAALYPDPPPDKDFRLLMRSCLPAGSHPSQDPVVWDSCYEELRSLTKREALDPELMERVRLETGSNTVPVELLLRTDLAGFGFREGWIKGFDGLDRDLLGDNVFCRILLNRALAVQAAYEAELGHSGRAITALVRGLQVARVPSHGTFMTGVGQLAAEAAILSVFERVLNRTSPDAEDLRRLQEALPRRANLAHDMMLHERAWQIHAWTHPESSWLFATPASRPPLERLAMGIGKLTRGYSGRLAMLDRWNRYLAATELPFQDQLRECREVGEAAQPEIDRFRNARFAHWQWLRLDAGLAAELEPGVGGAMTELALQLAQLANAQTAVAIERWRLAHPGRLPDSLADLVPAFLDAVPKDPFDAQPVRYRNLPRGFLVYCVGLDFTDDGGKEGRRGEKPGFDTTLTMER
jgi:hypothetical protein